MYPHNLVAIGCENWMLIDHRSVIRQLFSITTIRIHFEYVKGFGSDAGRNGELITVGCLNDGVIQTGKVAPGIIQLYLNIITSISATGHKKKRTNKKHDRPLSLILNNRLRLINLGVFESLELHIGLLVCVRQLFCKFI